MDTSSLICDSPIALIEEIDGPERMRDILLVIDWEAETITAETRHPSIDGTPARRWHGLESAYPLPPLVDAAALKDWVDEEVVPRAAPLCACFESEWDSHNWKGCFQGHEDEKEAFDYWITENARPPTHNGGLIDVEDWLDGGAALSGCDLNASTTDEQITALAEEIVDDARLEDVVVRGGPAAVAQYLRGLRDELPAPGPHTFSVQGHEIVEKTARASGTTARVLVPVSWVGCRVAVIRLEEKRS